MTLSSEVKPPAPYKHQDYPGMRYRAAADGPKDEPRAEHKLVANEDEDAQAAADGFTKEIPEAGTELIAPAPKAKAKPAPPKAKK